MPFLFQNLLQEIQANFFLKGKNVFLKFIANFKITLSMPTLMAKSGVCILHDLA
jgi:hypothetical protein